MSELTYTRCGDYYIPDLKLSEQPEAPIGKYGRMRQRYLKEHRPVLYSSLILSEKLYPHLLEIDRAARERMDAMLPRMMEAAGVTEELKSRDPMRWVGLMNTLKVPVEYTILQELISLQSCARQCSLCRSFYFCCAILLYSAGSTPVLFFTILIQPPASL